MRPSSTVAGTESGTGTAPLSAPTSGLLSALRSVQWSMPLSTPLKRTSFSSSPTSPSTGCPCVTAACTSAIERRPTATCRSALERRPSGCSCAADIAPLPTIPNVFVRLVLLCTRTARCTRGLQEEHDIQPAAIRDPRSCAPPPAGPRMCSPTTSTSTTCSSRSSTSTGRDPNARIALPDDGAHASLRTVRLLLLGNHTTTL